MLAGRVVCLGLAKDTRAQETGEIVGTVVDGEDGQPVAEAAVLVEGQPLAAVTNAIGRFEIAGSPAGAPWDWSPRRPATWTCGCRTCESHPAPGRW